MENKLENVAVVLAKGYQKRQFLSMCKSHGVLPVTSSFTLPCYAVFETSQTGCVAVGKSRDDDGTHWKDPYIFITWGEFKEMMEGEV